MVKSIHFVLRERDIIKISEKYTHVIWDFNGTILDDVETVISANNAMLSRRNMKLIDGIDDYLSKIDVPMLDFYRSLGFDFEKEKFTDLALEWGEDYRAAARSAKIYPDVKDTLERFKVLGLTQIIISASEKKLLKDQLSALGISEYFKEVLGLDDFHTIDKRAIAKEWRKQNPDARAVLIGDTENDVQIAKDMSCDCILKEGGHRSRASLSRYGLPIIPDTSELV